MPKIRIQNRLVDTASPAKSLYAVGGVCFLAFAITLAGALTGQLLLVPIFHKISQSLETTSWGHLLYLILGFGPVIFLMVLYSALFERRNLLSDVLADAYLLQHVCIGALLGALLVVIPVVYGCLVGTLSIELLPSNNPLMATVIAAMAGLIFQTFAEELVFRGWLLPTLVPRLGLVIAVGMSSAVFALTHLLNGGFSTVNFASLTLAGCVLGVVTLKTRSIWAAAIGHAFWNWTQYAGIAFNEKPAKAGAAFANVVGVNEPLPAGGNIEAWWVFTASAAVLVFMCAVVIKVKGKSTNSS